MGKLIVTVDSSRGQILDCPKKVTDFLYKKLSYLSEGCQFSDYFLSGRWDGYVRKFSRKTNTFPSGLLYRVLTNLKKLGYDFTLKDKRRLLDWDEDLVSSNIENFGYSLRPYQVDGLIKGITNPYMVFWWATSSGKTVLFSALISALKKKDFRETLILVSNRDLSSQHRRELGFMLDTEIGLIEEGRFEPKKITVAVINTLWNRAIKKKEARVLKYLSGVDHLISDETHRIIDSKMFKQTINKCNNTMARHGFSGTPFSLTTDDLELESVTGPPLSRVKMSDLIDEGWVSKPEVSMIKYDTQWMNGRASYPTVYRKQIVDNHVRNSLIVEIANDEFDDDKIVLILVRIIEHGKIIKDMLIDRGIHSSYVKFIHGSSPDSMRLKVKELMKAGEARLVIASQIWNEGIDIPAIDVLIKADGGGGKEVSDGRGIRSVIQQVGRVIRKPIEEGMSDVNTELENIVRVYDFYDDVHKDLLSHSRNRLLTYKMEKSFIVRSGTYEKIRSDRLNK